MLSQAFQINRNAFKDPEVVGLISGHLQHLELLHWQIDGHTHAAILTDQVQQILTKCAPLPENKGQAVLCVRCYLAGARQGY